MAKVTRHIGILKSFIKDSGLFLKFLSWYLKKKTFTSFLYFEKRKNILVKFFLMKRGKYNRAFLHFSMLTVLTVGILIAPILADTYPIFSTKASVSKIASPSTQERAITVNDNVFSTQVSDKPRDTIVTYAVQRGDTLETIAQKFSQPNNPISVNTIKWENDLNDDTLNVGQELRILPVNGLSYKVAAGDTVYTIAQKLKTNPQKVVDFPFNNFANPETFSLVEGQMLIVPDGIPSANQSVVTPVPQFIAQAPQQIQYSGSGFHWPLQGEITQGFSSYHPGIDIAGPVGTPIYAAKAGTVVEAGCGWNYGYGCHVVIDHADGYSTMYAHLSGQPLVSVGASVNGGQLIGSRGNTGRSTGPHTHFEIRSSHGNVNPLAYLQ